MREELAKIKGVRKRFCGKFQKYGWKKNWHGFSEKTICLAEVTDRTGKLFADHIWCNLTKTFEELGELKEGDVISFEATVTPYDTIARKPICFSNGMNGDIL
jgi:hypothetical protein